MTNANVKGWIANSAQFEDDGGSDLKFLDEDFSDDSTWEAFKAYARNQLLTSSTNSRCSFLEATLTPLVSQPSMLNTVH